MSALNERIDAFMSHICSEVFPDDGQASAFTTMPRPELEELGMQAFELFAEIGEPRDHPSALRATSLRLIWEWICDVSDLRKQQEVQG